MIYLSEIKCKKYTKQLQRKYKRFAKDDFMKGLRNLQNSMNAFNATKFNVYPRKSYLDLQVYLAYLAPHSSTLA